MTQLIKLLLETLKKSLFPRQPLVVENLALRHQLLVYQRNAKKLKLQNHDRIIWVFLSKFLKHWKDVLVIVKPKTVIRWHRQGFKLYWRWKSRSKKVGRNRTDPYIVKQIKNISRANPLWGAPRIHGELLKLGIEISESTVQRYMAKPQKPPSQTRRTFLENHVKDLISVDFMIVPTITFRLLFVFIVLSHDRRRIIHFNVTDSPTASWTGQQIVEVFPFESAPKYIIRDRDGIYGHEFRKRIHSMNIDEVQIAPRSPWQNPYVERVIGTIRRDCLDHIIVLNERHLKRILREYINKYYHPSRTHLSLNKDCPEYREVEPSEQGEIKSEPILGGLHHRYCRKAA